MSEQFGTDGCHFLLARSVSKGRRLPLLTLRANKKWADISVFLTSFIGNNQYELKAMCHETAQLQNSRFGLVKNGLTFQSS
jgi:hypothetical protein